MKTKILFTLAIICSTIAANAQVYQSIFGQNSTEWSVWYCQLDQSLVVDKVVGADVTFNGLQYKEVGVVENGTPNFAMYNGGTKAGGLREDTNTGKVWFYAMTTTFMGQSDTLEYLVMDLSLTLGDTFWVFEDYNNDSVPAIVDSVYMVNGAKHIRLDYETVTSAMTPIFIEGVGTNLGFAWQHESDAYNHCLCLVDYDKDGAAVYSGTCGGGINSLEDEMQESHMEVLVAPHPIISSSVLTFDNPQGIDATLVVYDAMGKQVLSKTTQDARVDIYNANLSGVYFYTLRLDDGSVSRGKLVYPN